MTINSRQNKQKILQNFLKLCETEGVSDVVLSLAVKESGIDQKYTNIIFENSIISLIEFHIEEINREIEKRLQNEINFHEKKIRQKIQFCLYNLFEIQKNNRLALVQIRNFYFDPKNFASTDLGPRPMLLALKNAGKISDAIWTAIGDQSTDFNYYTKRLTLAKIIIQSFNIFLKDESDDLQNTKNFIDEKIDGVMKFEKFKAKIRNYKNDIEDKSFQFFHNDKGEVKNLKEIVKDLPFIRLFLRSLFLSLSPPS